MKTRYGVKDRLTGEIVHKTRTAEQQTAHERAEAWCKKNLGDRGEIVELRVDEDVSQAAAALARKSNERITPAQVQARRENGKKGGRPRKMKDTTT